MKIKKDFQINDIYKIIEKIAEDFFVNISNITDDTYEIEKFFQELRVIIIKTESHILKFTTNPKNFKLKNDEIENIISKLSEIQISLKNGNIDCGKKNVLSEFLEVVTRFFNLDLNEYLDKHPYDEKSIIDYDFFYETDTFKGTRHSEEIGELLSELEKRLNFLEVSCDDISKKEYSELNVLEEIEKQVEDVEILEDEFEDVEIRKLNEINKKCEIENIEDLFYKKDKAKKYKEVENFEQMEKNLEKYIEFKEFKENMMSKEVEKLTEENERLKEIREPGEPKKIDQEEKTKEIKKSEEIVKGRTPNYRKPTISSEKKKRQKKLTKPTTQGISQNSKL